MDYEAEEKNYDMVDQLDILQIRSAIFDQSIKITLKKYGGSFSTKMTTYF